MGAWNCFSIENYLSVGLISRPFVPHTVTVNSERRMDTFEDHNRTYKKYPCKAKAGFALGNNNDLSHAVVANKIQQQS